MAEFRSLPLHDAILRSATVSWARRECALELDVFYERGERALPSTLVFTGLTAAEFPHRSPWGDSQFVNGSTIERPGRYVIEMQSGDRLVFEASSFSLSPLAAAQQGNEADRPPLTGSQ